jgi:3-oxoacyl-[acyl-carrier protein] reductase
MMADLLVQIGRYPSARRMVGKLGLPLSLPQSLRRSSGAWEARPFAARVAVAGGAPGGALARVVAKTLAGGGAETSVAALEPGPFREAAEAFGRPFTVVELESLSSGGPLDIAVFDASGIEQPTALRALYDFFHAVVPRLAPCARVAVLGRSPDAAASATAAGSRAALDGFVRSLAKEIGRRGATAQLVRVADGAEERLEAVLRFVLSSRAAFVTAQTLNVEARVMAPAEQTFVQPLERKVALVTGAARGIGAATARLLAREGARVVCLDRPADESAAGQLAREIGGSVLCVDIGAAEAPAAVERHLHDYHDGVDIVVHNAGIVRDRTLARMTPEMWDETLCVNLAAAPRIDDALIQHGILRDGGRIVCLASVVGIAGNAGQTNYAAAKAGLIGYVRRRADELASRGISVNAVAPGLIETPMSARMPRVVREAARRLSALGQGGLPSDVAEAVGFLATPAAAGITGSVLRVCGGALLGA